MNEIQNKTWSDCKHPLIISSSGGNGHLIAAQSLIEQLSLTSLPQHLEILPPQFKFPLNQILIALSRMYHHPHYGRWLAKISPVSLPHADDILTEMQTLKYRQSQQKPYLDFMLDLQPHGFILTALFNLIQKQSHGPSLHHLTYHQALLDKCSSTHIKQQLQQVLQHALTQHRPFDTILMTQPIGLKAIAQTVFDYNQARASLTQQYQCEIPPLFIHQFLTDIPGTQALHYLQAINHLPAELQQLLILHCMQLEELASGITAAKLAQLNFYNPKDLPIIRKAFKQNTLEPQQSNKKTASIMLSSAQGDLTAQYLENLVNLNFEQFLIIGELAASSQTKINTIAKDSGKLINYCGFVASNNLVQILQSSDCILLKGGGMSLMELSAIDLKPNALICLHQPQTDTGLTLGWEQGNMTWFLQHCRKKNQAVICCNPHQVTAQILSARL